MTTDTEGKT